MRRQTYEDGRLISPCSPLFEAVADSFRQTTSIDTFRRIVAANPGVRRSQTDGGQFFYSPHSVSFRLDPTTKFDSDELNQAAVSLQIADGSPVDPVSDLFRVLQKSLDRANCCMVFEPEPESGQLSLAAQSGFNFRLRRAGKVEGPVVLCSCSPDFSLVQEFNQQVDYRPLI